MPTKNPLLLLSQLHGEGRVTCRALQAAGFLTLRSVAEASLEELSDRAQLSARSAGRLQEGARRLIEQGEEADLAASPPVSGRRPDRSRSGLAARPEGPPSRSPGVLPEEAALLRGEEPGGLPGSAQKPARGA
jgi:hypothetical protein